MLFTGVWCSSCLLHGAPAWPAAGGVVLGVFGLRQNRKLRIMNFEDRFEQRYWQLMERLSLAALQGETQADHGACGGPDEKVMRSYFRLCESELNVRAAGWVTDNTWHL